MLLLLFCFVLLVCGARRELVLEFDSEQNGLPLQAHTQTMVSRGLCFATLSESDGLVAQWEAARRVVNASTYLENVTISFGADLLFFSSPLACNAFAASSLHYGACPYEIVGGSGRFAGATGSSASIWYFVNPNEVKVFGKSVSL
jgi:hypothetical protein